MKQVEEAHSVMAFWLAGVHRVLPLAWHQSPVRLTAGTHHVCNCLCRSVCCFVCTRLGVGGWKSDRLAAEAARLLGQHPGMLGTAQGPRLPAALQHLF